MKEQQLAIEIRSAAVAAMDIVVKRIEIAEAIAIRSIPKSPAAARRQLANLQLALSEATTLASAVAIMMTSET